MAIKGLEKLGAVAGFIPFVSSVSGIIKAYIYYGKAQKDKPERDNVKNTATKIDDLSHQTLNSIREEKSGCYNKLWKASLAETIPFFNIIAAVYSAVVLSKLSGLRDTKKEVIEKATKNIPVVNPKPTANSITKENADLFKLLGIKNLESVNTNLKKCELLNKAKELLRVAENPFQIKQLLEIEKNLQLELLEVLPDYLDKVLANSKREIFDHQKAVEPLLQPFQVDVQNLPLDDFIVKFKEETSKRFQSLNFYQVKPFEEKILQELTKINPSSSFSTTINRLNENQEVIEEKGSLEQLKESLEQQLIFYKDLRSSLEETYQYQDGLLHPKKLGLEAHLPLNYSSEADDYFMKHEKEWSEVFKNTPNEYPVSITNPNGGGLATIKDEIAFFKLRDKYKSLKNEIHDQMVKCLPKEYPIQLPNFLSPTGDPGIEIQNEAEFKKMVSNYASYIENRNKTMKSLRLLITEKTKTLSNLKNI
jgi:hypothetical protein